MGVESVRQATIGSGLETPQSAESEEIQIELHLPEDPPRFDDIDDYLFPEQDIIKGEYHYQSSPRFGQPETGEGQFEIRTGSGMIILHSRDDRPRPKKIFRALDQVINGEAEINQNFVPNQNQMWDFVEWAEERREVKVITPSGRIKSTGEVDVAWEEMRGQYPIEVASLVFYHDGDPISVRYNEDSLVIEPNEETAREYVIQIFESVMTQ
jgi:hypothetical protein